MKKINLVYHNNPNSLFLVVKSKLYPHETTLACPNCPSTAIFMIGKNLRGEGLEYTECRSCGFRVVKI